MDLRRWIKKNGLIRAIFLSYLLKSIVKMSSFSFISLRLPRNKQIHMHLALWLRVLDCNGISHCWNEGG